jgi:hypothetical protein
MTDEEIGKKILASGIPLHIAKIDLPMKIIREEGGALSIDSPTVELLGFDHLGVVRVHITALAVGSLKGAFAELEKNPDMRVLEIPRPTAN